MNLRSYTQASVSGRREMVARVATGLDPRFRLKWRPASEYLARFLDKQSELTFILIPGGTFRMGLSKYEERAARRISTPIPARLSEMRPTREVLVDPFLMSETPVLNKLAGLQESGRQFDPNRPAFLTRQEAVDLAVALGCRLPWEREWEYACRAGTQSLFVFGDMLPPDRELKHWLSSDFSKLSRVRPNPFGLRGMFTGEWCQDTFRVNLSERGRLVRGSYVVRGGGAIFWPWQDEEWVWCMSAMRMPSKGLIKKVCGLRLVHDLSDTQTSGSRPAKRGS